LTLGNDVPSLTCGATAQRPHAIHDKYAPNDTAIHGNMRPTAICNPSAAGSPAREQGDVPLYHYLLGRY